MLLIFPCSRLSAIITETCVKINVVINEVCCAFPRQGADLNSIDCKGHSPLLLATSCGAWKTVTLLLSKGECLCSTVIDHQQCSHCFVKSPITQTCSCLLGANVNVKDRCGCNFLHLAILQPKGLKNLPEEVLQVPSVNAACL